MKKYDLVVVGGGVAGVSAALSAARKGLAVALVEKTNSSLFPFVLYQLTSFPSFKLFDFIS